MDLKKLFESPSSKKLKLEIFFGFILCFIAIPIMQYFTDLSEFPAEIFSSQLSFSGDQMKSYYASTNVDFYRIAPILDYIFMVGYGLILFSTSVLIARIFKGSLKIGLFGLVMAVLGVIAACCDGIENIFILAMLTDPAGFPDVWAILHSIFALIKWIILFLVISWIIIAGYFIFLSKKNN